MKKGIDYNEHDGKKGRTYHKGFGYYGTYSKKEGIQMNLFILIIIIIFFVIPFLIVNYT